MDIKWLVPCLFLAALFVPGAPVSAGEYQEGVAAVERGDYDQALGWLRPLGEKGDQRAQDLISKINTYLDANAALEREDYGEALRLLRPLAEHGDQRAQEKSFKINGYVALIRGDYSEALRQWQPLAEHDQVGYYQDFIDFIYQQSSEGAKFIREEANRGNAQAQTCMARLYQSGQGVAEDQIESRRWLRKAAEQGYAYAQYELGKSYFLGQGVPMDYVEAYKWFNLAAARAKAFEQSEARKFRDWLTETKLTPAQVAEGQRRASQWQSKRQ